MNIPATPPSSAGLIDRLAEMADGLRRSLDQDGGGSLGNVLFVMIAVHCLLRFAFRYLRLKAGLLAPLRTDAAGSRPSRVGIAITPRRASRPVASTHASGAAHDGRRENWEGEPHAGDTQAPVAGDAAPLCSPATPGLRILRTATTSRRPWATVPHLVVRARSRTPRFSTGLGKAGFVRP